MSGYSVLKISIECPLHSDSKTFKYETHSKKGEGKYINLFTNKHILKHCKNGDKYKQKNK